MDPIQRWTQTATRTAPERPLDPPEDGVEIDSDDLDARCLEEAQEIIVDASRLRKEINDEELAYPIADICDVLQDAINEYANIPGLTPNLAKLLRGCHLLEKAILAIVNDEHFRDEMEATIAGELNDREAA